MRVMDHPVFRRFWYPVIPMSLLEDGPQRFELLGQPLALFLDRQRQPAALEDRCCHRSARLSQGKVCNGALACPYHGWQYDRSGQCVLVPQLPDAGQHGKRKVRAFRCEQRYGYAWVALDDPVQDIPRIPEAEDPGFLIVHEFYEEWKVHPLRVMENELDMAHPAFVHLGTFGNPAFLTPREQKVTEFDGGLHYSSKIPVDIAHHAQDRQNERDIDATWHLPFVCRIRMNYPDGPPHILVNAQVPIDDGRTMLVQFILLANQGQGMDVEKIVAFDRAVTLEDKALLEGTESDVPLDLTREQHMPTDQAGIVMRRSLQKLFDRYEIDVAEAAAD
ncbi:MAG: Phenylpropionate dioxygenase (Rieske 2Fe-2S family) protein [Herbaspirillum sp.]|jgi:phenylpropionate dioxygenase-like ring-hydroxylating dioxygenase large terminal subunit|nr:Phenylpropionate dioxygenase (Rieske 2Fe-2S family) protein [Herbaspirillum sp.]